MIVPERKEPTQNMIFSAILSGYKEMIGLLAREELLDYSFQFKTDYLHKYSGMNPDDAKVLNGLPVIEFAIATKNLDCVRAMIDNGGTRLIHHLNERRSDILSRLDVTGAPDDIERSVLSLVDEPSDEHVSEHEHSSSGENTPSKPRI